MPKFGQGCANGGGFFLIDKGGSNFGFSRGGHDVAHNLGDGVDGSIEGRVGGWRVMGMRGAVTEEVVAVGTAAGVGLREVGGVAVHMKDYVASNIANSGVGVRGRIIEQPDDFVISGSGGFVLLGSNGSESTIMMDSTAMA